MKLDEDRTSQIDHDLVEPLRRMQHIGDDRPVWIGPYRPEGHPTEAAQWTLAHYRYYLSFVRDHMDHPGRVLDIGCGVGNMAAMLGRYSTEVVGLDKIAEVIDFARTHNSSDKVSFLVGDFPCEIAGPFDYIFAVEVLEHTDRSRQQAFLAKATSLLAPGGKLFLTMPVS